MNIEHGTFEVYWQYWRLWFGDDKPHTVKGFEIIELSYQIRQPLEFLMDQVFLVHYDAFEEDTTVGLSGGWVKGSHHLHTYIPKYCLQMFHRGDDKHMGNVHYFKTDQIWGMNNSVYRIQPRPIRGFRHGFVTRLNRWVKAANHWTNNGFVDGYPANVLEIYQPIMHKGNKRKQGDCKNQPYDYALIQVPREYANVMVADGLFPAEFDDYTSIIVPDWPKKWPHNIPPEVQVQVNQKRQEGLERWRTRHRIEKEAERAAEKARKAHERYMADKRKTGPKVAEDYKYDTHHVTVID